MLDEATNGHDHENQQKDHLRPYKAIQGHIRPYKATYGQTSQTPKYQNTKMYHRKLKEHFLFPSTFFVPLGPFFVP